MYDALLEALLPDSPGFPLASAAAARAEVVGEPSGSTSASGE